MAQRDGYDEHRHAPGDGRRWAEWWWFEVARADGAGVTVRCTQWPYAGRSWYWAAIVLPGDPRPIVVRDHDLAIPRRDDLEIKGPEFWCECRCDEEFEHWTVGLETYGVRLDDPEDAFRGEYGERLPVGLDLDFDLVTGPWGDPSDYEQVARVDGEVLAGRDAVALDAVAGLRGHVFGVQDGPPAARGWLGAVGTAGASGWSRPSCGRGYRWSLDGGTAATDDVDASPSGACIALAPVLAGATDVAVRLRRELWRETVGGVDAAGWWERAEL